MICLPKKIAFSTLSLVNYFCAGINPRALNGCQVAISAIKWVEKQLRLAERRDKLKVCRIQGPVSGVDSAP